MESREVCFSMSLEKSVLTPDLIVKLLRKKYGLKTHAVQRLKLGSANCYRVDDDGNRYFLKEFQRGFSKSDLNREAHLTDHLIRHGIATARFIRTLSGAAFFVYKGHLICLEEYIDGITFHYNNFPQKYLPETAATLGRLHQTLRGYRLPVDMGEDWLSSFSAQHSIRQYDELLRVLETKKEDKNYNRIKSDLNYKKDLILRKSDQLIRSYQNITYTATHGDFQGCQLICDDDHIKAIIDFSSSRILPATWELMRSYVQSSKTCRATAQIDLEEFCRYVREYLKFFPLTGTDLQAMPDVYLFQLMRSKYGYPQYLLGDSEDREELLQFAFWRTDICREIERKSEQISAMLRGLR